VHLSGQETSTAKNIRPAWQLPPGVSRGTWDYLHSPSIADDYDSYFNDHPLLKLDIHLLHRYLPEPPEGSDDCQITVADFGCGTARVARALMPLGYRVLNVDMSQPMLYQAIGLCGEHPRLSACVRGNLVQMDWLRDDVLDMAVCLFSSIGMIRGRDNRQAFLQHVHRCLKKEARLVVHVHNRLRSLLDPGGPRWLLSTRWKSWTGRDWEYGDRVYNYRGLPAMFLHIYSRRELVEDLQAAGFRKMEILPINSTASALMKAKTLLSNVRAGGYIAIVTK
jgi:SAM-dependent methyltransferase